MKWILILCLTLCGCTLFSKSEPQSDELVALTDDVLKKGTGVEIDVKPIEKPSKK